MRRLLNAANAVFADRGYHAARVDDVVRAAHTSHGTFYLYFTNMDDLLYVLAEECARDMTDVVESLAEIGPGADGLAELARFLRDFVGLSHRHGAVLRAWAEGASDHLELRRLGARTWRHMASRIDQRISQARSDQVDSRAAAVALIAMLERLAYFRLSRGVETDDEAGYTTVARVVHRGFFAGQPA